LYLFYERVVACCCYSGTVVVVVFIGEGGLSSIVVVVVVGNDIPLSHSHNVIILSSSFGGMSSIPASGR
jgi:hypothetical protein